MHDVIHSGPLLDTDWHYLRSKESQERGLASAFEKFIGDQLTTCSGTNRLLLFPKVLVLPLALNLFGSDPESAFAHLCEDKLKGALDEVKEKFKTHIQCRLQLKPQDANTDPSFRIKEEAVELVTGNYRFINDQCLRFIDFAILENDSHTWAIVKTFILLLHYLKANTGPEMKNALAGISNSAPDLQKALGNGLIPYLNLQKEIVDYEDTKLFLNTAANIEYKRWDCFKLCKEQWTN